MYAYLSIKKYIFFLNYWVFCSLLSIYACGHAWFLVWGMWGGCVGSYYLELWSVSGSLYVIFILLRVIYMVQQVLLYFLNKTKHAPSRIINQQQQHDKERWHTTLNKLEATMIMHFNFNYTRIDKLCTTWEEKWSD